MIRDYVLRKIPKIWASVEQGGKQSRMIQQDILCLKYLNIEYIKRVGGVSSGHLIYCQNKLNQKGKQVKISLHFHLGPVRTLESFASFPLLSEQFKSKIVALHPQIVFELILGSNFDMDLLQPASETLFTLICCHQQEYMKMAQALLEGQHNTENADRLRTSFHELTPSTLKLSIDKASISTFRKNLEKFLLDVKGFLFVK